MRELYSNLEILNPEKHKNLRILPPKDFKYFRNLNSCVILVTEFFEAAKFYPIVFMRTPAEGLVPVIILGAEDNVFIDEKGKWKEGFYVPAFVRRYPFIFVEDKEINKQAGERKLFVGIDKNYKGFGEEEGEKLFDDEGKETSFLKDVVKFLLTYDRDFQLTKQFVDKLEKLELFQGIEATVKTQDGKTVIIKNLLAVEENKFNNLPNDKVVELFKKGFLGTIYAHLMSLTNFSKIVG